MFRLILLVTVGAIVLLWFAGCEGVTIVPTDFRDTAITDSNGEAAMYLDGGYETLTARNSSTDERISDIQVLGMADGAHRLYVAADPHGDYHPAIGSGVERSYNDRDFYLSPADYHQGSNTTSYHEISLRLLDQLVYQYGGTRQQVRVSGLRDLLSHEASGYTEGLVVCIDQPLSSSSDYPTAVEIAQQSTNLASAFQAIGWQYIYTSRGFSTTQNLNVWLIDPYDLQITGVDGSAGALRDTLIAVVAPSSSPSGNVLPGSLRVEVRWDEPVDLDLHLVRNGADLYDASNDCFWQYFEQEWGSSQRSTDNPRLFFDDVDGFGPETIVMDEMTPGDTYTVVLDYWGDDQEKPTNIPTTATVRVWTNGGETSRTFTVTGLDYGEPWKGDYAIVCDINGDTGEIVAANRTLNRSVTRTGMRKHK